MAKKPKTKTKAPVAQSKQLTKEEQEIASHAPWEYSTRTMVCARFGEEIVVLGKTRDGQYVVVGAFTDAMTGKPIFLPTGIGIELSDMEELLEMQQHFTSGV